MSTPTPFAVLAPREIVMEPGTAFGHSVTKAAGRGPMRLRQRSEDLTALIDEVLLANHGSTTFTQDVGWARLELEGSSETEEAALTTRVLEAVSEVRSMLDISEAATARLIGVARNTLASWRSGKRAPYPATVRRLFEVHSVLVAANTLLGAAEARAWIHGVGESERPRSEVLAEEGGIAVLTAELRRGLFTKTPETSLPMASDLLDEEEDAQSDEPYRPESFSGPLVDEPQVP